MTWGKLDDKFHRNRKVRELRKTKPGRVALGAWVFWWSWCLDDPELTGIVPTSELPADDLKSAALLVQSGLWEVTENGFRFHDFNKYNPTKEQRAAKLEYDRGFSASKRASEKGSVVNDVVYDSQPTSYPRARAGSGRDGTGTGKTSLAERDKLAVAGESPASLAALAALKAGAR